MPELFCNKHNQVHRLTAGELERAFYALSADYAEAAVELEGADERLYAGEEFYDHVPCPIALVASSNDTESWFEWVNGLVESRRRNAQKER